MRSSSGSAAFSKRGLARRSGETSSTSTSFRSSASNTSCQSSALAELTVRARIPARSAAATWSRIRASSGEMTTLGPAPGGPAGCGRRPVHGRLAPAGRLDEQHPAAFGDQGVDRLDLISPGDGVRPGHRGQDAAQRLDRADPTASARAAVAGRGRSGSMSKAMPAVSRTGASAATVTAGRRRRSAAGRTPTGPPSSGRVLVAVGIRAQQRGADTVVEAGAVGLRPPPARPRLVSTTRAAAGRATRRRSGRAGASDRDHGAGRRSPIWAFAIWFDMATPHSGWRAEHCRASPATCLGAEAGVRDQVAADADRARWSATRQHDQNRDDRGHGQRPDPPERALGGVDRGQPQRRRWTRRGGRCWNGARDRRCRREAGLGDGGPGAPPRRGPAWARRSGSPLPVDEWRAADRAPGQRAASMRSGCRSGALDRPDAREGRSCRPGARARAPMPRRPPLGDRGGALPPLGDRRGRVVVLVGERRARGGRRRRRRGRRRGRRGPGRLGG